MDRIEFAQRRFRQILSKPAIPLRPFPVREVNEWLTECVCPIVFEHKLRPAFLERATWPLRLWIVDAGTVERKLVDEMSRALVELASALQKIGKRRTVQRKLQEIKESHSSSLQPTVEVTKFDSRQGKVERPLRRTSNASAAFLLAVRQLPEIAEPFWTDLVSPFDYLEPTAAWLERPEYRTPGVSFGEFTTSLNPRLHEVGDIVSRCLLIRAECHRDQLGIVFRHLLSMIGSKDKSGKTSIDELWNRVEACLSKLRRVIAGPESLPRDACVVLAQTYVAFNPVEDWKWLGLGIPDANIRAWRSAMQSRFAHHHAVKMIERIDHAVDEFGRIIANCPAEQSVTESAIATGQLVLIDGNRKAYFDGVEIEAPWSDTDVLWRLLWTLAEFGRLKRPVAPRDIYPNDSTTSLAEPIRRLKLSLPDELRQRIRSSRGTGTYFLDIDKEKIHLA